MAPLSAGLASDFNIESLGRGECIPALEFDPLSPPLAWLPIPPPAVIDVLRAAPPLAADTRYRPPTVRALIVE